MSNLPQHALREAERAVDAACPQTATAWALIAIAAHLIESKPKPARTRRPGALIDTIRPKMADARARGWTQAEIDRVILRLCDEGIHFLTDAEIAELCAVIAGEKP